MGRTGNSNESSLSQLVNIEDIAFVPKQPRAQVNENYLRKKTEDAKEEGGKGGRKSKKKRPRKRYRNRGYYDSSEDEDRNADILTRKSPASQTNKVEIQEEIQNILSLGKTKGTCSPNSKQYSDDNRIVQTSGLSESSLTDVKGKNVDVNVSEDNVDELLDDSVRIIDGNNNEQEGDKKLTQGDL